MKTIKEKTSQDGATQGINEFERQTAEGASGGLYSLGIETLQVNLGLRCNQRCCHCHLGASPERTEMMDWRTMELVLKAVAQSKCRVVDLTGGAPELNPCFQKFVTELSDSRQTVQVRTNLTALLEPGMGATPEFFRNYGVHLVASLPCYMEENVRAQRGEGVYEKSIEAIHRLNTLGYGTDPGLPLSLVYNPGGPFLPPEQSALEADYRHDLSQRFGIHFTHLLTITNMPIGRFRQALRHRNQEQDYLRLLKKSFNPQTVEGLMCRHQLSVGWDGLLYDCDFNLALALPVNHGAPDHIRNFDLSHLLKRRIVTANHCFGCTAGFGSSCGGALSL